MQQQTALYKMADRVAGGHLAQILTDYSEQGYSLHEMTRRLYAEHDVEVTPPTVGAWLRRLDLREVSS